MDTENKNVKGNKPGKVLIKILMLVLLLSGLFGLITGKIFDSEYGSPFLNLLVTVIFPIFYLWPDIVNLTKSKADKS